MKERIIILDEVNEALKQKKPIVAFETTIITYGLPYPENLEVALEVEKIARKNKVTPATIGIINGKIHIGLNKKQLEYMANPKNKSEIEKVSRQNLAAVLAKNKSGATTVAATMMICNLMGIEVFVTGGIGGVHRHASETFDISADLREFEKSKVAVISSGIKSILDIKLTLEYLETSGILVAGYKCSELPAFYSRKSGHKVSVTINSIEELAKLVKLNFKYANSGILITNPIPTKDEISSQKISMLVDEIVNKADPNDIDGPKYTPYVLEKLHEITKGKTLKANSALIKNNAQLGAKLAFELNKYKDK